MYLRRVGIDKPEPSLYSSHTKSELSSYPSSASSYNRDDSNPIHKRKSNFGNLGNNIIGGPVKPSHDIITKDYISKRPLDYVSRKGEYSVNTFKTDPIASTNYSSGITSNNTSQNEDYWNRASQHRRTEPSSNQYSDALLKAKSNIDSVGLNETFTSQKAKRNVSEYHKTANPRQVYSRERQSPSQVSTTSPNFPMIGLENIGNT